MAPSEVAAGLGKMTLCKENVENHVSSQNGVNGSRVFNNNDKPQEMRIKTSLGDAAVHVYNPGNTEKNDYLSTPFQKNEAFNDEMPLEVTIKTAHGDTAVHVYNPEATETVVLAHGCGGKKEQFRKGRMAQRLASKFRVITFDWYGHGTSPPCPENYRKEEFLEQLNCIVDVMVPLGETIHLYGFSMGCFLTLHYAAMFPHRVRRLVLHSPWNAETSIFAPGTKSAVRIPLFGIAGLAVVRHTSFPFCHNAATFKRILLTLGEGNKAWHKLLSRLSIVGGDTLEMMLICGSGETPFYRVAKEIDKEFEGSSQLFVYPKSQHMSWCEKWDQPVGSYFRNRIYDFLAKQD